MRISYFSLLIFLMLTVACKDDVIASLPDENETGAGSDTELFDRSMYVVRSYRHPKSSSYELTESVLVTWRSMPGESTAFDIYKVTGDAAPVKLNEAPIQSSTNLVDSPNFDVNNTYILKEAGTDVELDKYVLTTVQATEPYIKLPLRHIENPDDSHPYKLKDICVGDLNGDGKLDFVIRRECDAFDVGSNRKTAPVGSAVLEGYTMEGIFLWRVTLGPNIPQGEHTVPFVVCDLDGDGIAEVVVRTSELTTFGDGYQQPGSVWSSDNNPRANGAPEYLSVINGTTGALMAQVDYINPGPVSEWKTVWGDNWGNRANRHLMAIGYFNGNTPSIFVSRGYYGGTTIMQTWDYNGKDNMNKKWEFKASRNGPNVAYDGQGNHQIIIADINNDGNHDVIFGAITVNSNGVPIHSYGYAHGDCIMAGKYIKGSTGLQIWSSFETGSMGASFRDGLGGEYFNMPSTNDVGRALIANIDPDTEGYLMWTSSNNGATYDTKGNLKFNIKDHAGSKSVTTYTLMAAWWTGSLNRQLLNTTSIDRFKGSTEGGFERVQNFGPLGASGYNNKPLLIADVFGDWREEIFYPSEDHQSVIIVSTYHETKARIPYLLSDRTYRLSVINQNVGYNQSTSTGFYIGPDMFD